MKQKLMVVAVAGALAVPGLAAAQVTISGSLGMAYASAKIGGVTTARDAAGLNKTSTFMESDARIRFSVVEALGGGTDFYGYYEFAPVLDGSTDTTGSGNPAGAGGVQSALTVTSNNPGSYVGLRNKAWGAIRLGTIGVWSSKGSVEGPKAYHYGASRVTDYVNNTSLGSGSHRNMIVYDTPDMGAFSLTLAYSTSPLNNDQDLVSAAPKGSAWYLAPEFNAGFAKIGWVHMDVKEERDDATLAGVGGTALTAQQKWKDDKIYINGSIAGFNTGVTIAKGTGSLAGVKNVSQGSWYIPISYSVGEHMFGVSFGKAKDNTLAAGDQSAKYTGVAYQYSLSKRTNISASYNKMDNAAAGSLDLSGSTVTPGAAVGFSTAAGEDQTVIAIALQHTF